ncbi:MAG TPA: type II toxin-antitoxin system prevent-host-death family antitoxin [Terriglobales bacterium]|jgi:prevent-host-death family protein|nr:type II toxin-antitoxin system prevent-host-death family antitoxin [Terriglobales bacterium]
MPRVTIHQAKANLSELIEPVERGEEILIAIGKRVVAKIVPVAQAPNQRRLDILRGKFKVTSKFFEPLSQNELKGWR